MPVTLPYVLAWTSIPALIYWLTLQSQGFPVCLLNQIHAGYKSQLQHQKLGGELNIHFSRQNYSEMSWTLRTTKARWQRLFFCRRTLWEYCSWKCRNAPPGSATRGHLTKWVWISQVLPHMGSLGPASLFPREDITGVLWIKTSVNRLAFLLAVTTHKFLVRHHSLHITTAFSDSTAQET